MKHILRSLPLPKPFCPHYVRHHTHRNIHYMLCLLHTRYTYTGTVLHLGAPVRVRPPTLRSRRPHGRPLRAARRLPARVPPSLPRSHRSFPTFTMRETERAKDGREGRKITHGADAADVTLYTITCDPWARQGWEGWVASPPKQESQHLPYLPILPWFHLPPRLSPFSSSHLSPPGNACEARVYGNGWHAHGRTALSGCCSSGLPRENESGLW